MDDTTNSWGLLLQWYHERIVISRILGYWIVFSIVYWDGHIKIPRCRPLWGESRGDQRSPSQMARYAESMLCNDVIMVHQSPDPHYNGIIMSTMAFQITSLTRKCFHLMTSSCYQTATEPFRNPLTLLWYNRDLILVQKRLHKSYIEDP